MQVIIVGGGIAGLSQALSLHQIGIACRVYDAVPVLSPLGYGINLQPNAIRELTALGLGDQLAAAGILTKELAFYNKHGQLIWSEPRGRAAGYRWPQISISRGELHKVLLAAIHERLGAQAVVTGHRLTSFEQRGDKVIARFADPSGKPAGEAEGDILIGADGIHSAVRQHFYQGEKAVFDGYLHYRGIVEAGALSHRRVDGGGRSSLSSRHHLSGDAAPRRQGDDQLARLYENSAGLAAARSLGHRRRQAGLRRSVQGLDLSVARRAGPVRGDAGGRMCCNCRTSTAIRSRAGVSAASP